MLQRLCEIGATIEDRWEGKGRKGKEREKLEVMTRSAMATPHLPRLDHDDYCGFSCSEKMHESDHRGGIICMVVWHSEDETNGICAAEWTYEPLMLTLLTSD